MTAMTQWTEGTQPPEELVQTDTPLISPSGPADVRLEHGVPGLSEVTDWTLTPLEASTGGSSAFYMLASSADPELSLIVADPWTFFADYAPDLPDNELEAVGITSVEQTIVFCPVTLDAGEGCFYLNLLGPLVFHTSTGAGRQIVLSDQEWPVRARVDVQG
ncbi:MAG: flagellar assembly protein FliW [Actinomycetota bacterium]|jgi:flagellar assembly factor FliW|nr:flagellar assembly protein FliW [Actinomycetota bacterium]